MTLSSESPSSKCGTLGSLIIRQEGLKLLCPFPSIATGVHIWQCKSCGRVWERPDCSDSCADWQEL